MAGKYDVIVIGAGPAGYIAAIRASQNGMKVACIDQWENRDGKHAFGGTCLNAGCIPSKALLESSELVHRAETEFGKHGIRLSKVEVDLEAMQKRKQGIVRQLTNGIAGLFKANKVEGLQMVGPEQIKEIEPHVAALRALWAPGTGIVDYRKVVSVYADKVRYAGGEIRFNSRLDRVVTQNGSVVLETQTGAIETKNVINCAGLHCDRVARLCGLRPEVRIIPFRGEYYRLRPGRDASSRGNWGRYNPSPRCPSCKRSARPSGTPC